MLWAVALVLLTAPLVMADVMGCKCEAADLSARECSLCREAQNQPEGVTVFFLKDINPRKPNRWLALPKAHLDGPHALHELSPKLRTELWTKAIEKARELWGDEWGIAYNAAKVRTQCHTHVHIGKLLRGLAPGKFYDVSSPSEIKVMDDHSGLWIHPVGDKIRVHYGEGITETVLLR